MEKKADSAYLAKDFGAALPLYETLAKEQPKAPRMLYRLGVCQVKTGDFKAAEQSLKKAKELGAPTGPVAYNLACALISRGDRANGLAELEAASKAGFPRSGDEVRNEKAFDGVRSDARYVKALAKIENPLVDVPGGTAMDHWVGEWEVFYAGQKIGENSIKKVLRGYGITEAYRPGGNVVEGMSLFSFDIMGMPSFPGGT